MKVCSSKLVLFVGAFILSAGMLFSQETETASARGKVIDASTGEAMIGVVVVHMDSGVYAMTDFEGEYELEGLPAGTITLSYRMFGYDEVTEDVTLTAGESEKVNISMGYQTVGAFVVTGRRVTDTAAALLAEQQKAPTAQDAISAEQIAKTPDSDAGDAAKRVTGVTVIGGENVYIRGLGERYSAVMFADTIIPSPDPDKRVVPLDIFPTALLDNIIVKKAYSPDMPADFGGGIVMITPKDYPEDEEFKVSFSGGWGFGTTFSDFYTYEGGALDFFGFDDGTRDYPDLIGSSDIDNYTSEAIEQIGEDFNNVYTPYTSTAFPSINLSMSYGNTFELKNGNDLGVIFSGLFKNSYDTDEIDDYIRVNDNFSTNQDYDFDISKYSTTKGLLGSFALKSDSSTYSFTSFVSHNTADTAQIQTGVDSDKQQALSNYTTVEVYKLQYVSETLFFNKLDGTHYLGESRKTELEWNLNYALAKRIEPDTRTTELYDNDTTGDYYLLYGDDVTRYFQQHLENIYDGGIEMTLPFKQWQGIESDFVFGGGVNYRERNSSSRLFAWNSPASGDTTTTPADVEDLLDPDHIVGGVGGTGGMANYYYITEETGEGSAYSGNLLTASGYALVDMQLLRKLRLLGGVRYEYTDMDVYYYDALIGDTTDLAQEPLNANNLFPAANFTWELNDDMNLRLAGSKTVARPDFREVTPFKYTLMQSSATVHGNTNLVQTDIYNADLRWEWYPSDEELVAVSLFYKYMIHPIEILEVTGSTGGDEYTYKNAGAAQNMGVELELRKDFGFIAKALSDFSTSMNFSYIYSRVDIEDTAVANYATDDRPLQGQSPYVVNANLDYENDDAGFSATLLFNIQGRYIERVVLVTGAAVNGDVYVEAAPTLDFVAKKEFGAEENHSLKFKIVNILNPELKITQERQNSSTGDRETFVLESYREGLSASLSYSYSF